MALSTGDTAVLGLHLFLFFLFNCVFLHLKQVHVIGIGHGINGIGQATLRKKDKTKE